MFSKIEHSSIFNFELRKFVQRLFSFLVLISLVGISLSYLIDSGLRKSNLIPYKAWNDVLGSKINADILIQGSSRAAVHYSPALIDSTFNLGSYNIGLDGKTFRIQYFRFLLYLKHNKQPKYIIQNVDNRTLGIDSGGFDPQFLPYLNINEIETAVERYNTITWPDKHIPLYKYHGNYELVIKGLMSYFNFSYTQHKIDYKGFMTHDKKWDSSFREYVKSRPNGWYDQVDSDTKGLFEEFLNVCRDRGIKVIFIYAPEFHESQKLSLSRDSITNIFTSFSKVYSIPFLDYSDNDICLDSSFFYNSHHLNSYGLKKYERIYLNDLKLILR